MTDATHAPGPNADEVGVGMAPTPGYRYPDQVGDTLYVAGQVPLDATGSIVAIGDTGAHATACMRNLDAILGVHGFHTSDIRQLAVHVVGDRGELYTAWQAVVDWFDGSVPPATLLVAALIGHVHQVVEIDATVRRKPS